MGQPSSKLSQFKTLFCKIMLKWNYNNIGGEYASMSLKTILYQGLIEDHLDLGPTKDVQVFQKHLPSQALPKISTFSTN